MNNDRSNQGPDHNPSVLRKASFWVTAVVVLLLSFGVSLIWHMHHLTRPLPVYYSVEGFQLIDQDGRLFSSTKLIDKIWVVDFIFTTCSSICPIMTKNMAALHRSFQGVDDVVFVSISVNPEQDTPQRLKEFGERYGADFTRWRFLTGPRAMIQRIAVGSFKLGSVEEPVFHSEKFVLVDRKGRIRGYYDGTNTKEIKRLVSDIALLLRSEALPPSYSDEP